MKTINPISISAIIFGLILCAGLINSQSAIANDEFGLLACMGDSDCASGYSCRSKKGGGTECRNRFGEISDAKTSMHAQECLTDSDCPRGQSCRSKSQGGAICKPIGASVSSSFTPPPTSNSIPVAPPAPQQPQQPQQTQEFMQEVATALNQFGQQMQSSGQQMQQNIMMMPATTPNFQPFAPSGGRNRVNCITTGVITNCR